jgi:hypothetical protein
MLCHNSTRSGPERVASSPLAAERQALGGLKAINIMWRTTLRIARALIVALIAAVSTVAVHGRPQASAPAQVAVTGDVKDETGRPVPGAEVRVRSSSVPDTSVLTDSGGAFSVRFPAVSQLSIVASHPDYGQQWPGGVESGRSSWTAYQYFGSLPSSAVHLQLRRGVILRGRALDPSGRPFGRETLLLVPSYIGSGPSTIEATTDSDGRFEFERMVLKSFELVARGLDHWHPRTAGTYLRIAPNVWVSAAVAGQPIELRLQSYTLVEATLDVSSFQVAGVQVWTRSGAGSSMGSALNVDARGQVRALMELGVAHELWVVPGTGTNMVAPWTRGLRPQWTGTPRGRFTLRIDPS